MKRKHKKTELLNPLEIHQLLNAIEGKDYRKDTEFINEWRKVPFLKKVYYWLQTFYDSHVGKYFIKEENLMLPDIEIEESGYKNHEMIPYLQNETNNSDKRREYEN
jgi:hypothetical protein